MCVCVCGSDGDGDGDGGGGGGGGGRGGGGGGGGFSLGEHNVTDLDEDTAGADTGLPCISERRGDSHLGRNLNVGIIEDDERCIASQL